MMMIMNSVPSNWKRRSQLSFPWVITITLLTRLHLRPIMHIAHPESVEDTISFIIVIIAKKNVSLDYERGLHTFYLINSLSSSEGKGAKETIVEILTESQKWIQNQTQKSPPSTFSANLKNVCFHDFILWNTGWYISPESFLTNPSEVFGGRWCNCVQITLRCEITVSRILLVNFHWQRGLKVSLWNYLPDHQKWSLTRTWQK